MYFARTPRAGRGRVLRVLRFFLSRDTLTCHNVSRQKPPPPGYWRCSSATHRPPPPLRRARPRAGPAPAPAPPGGGAVEFADLSRARDAGRRRAAAPATRGSLVSHKVDVIYATLVALTTVATRQNVPFSSLIIISHVMAA